MIDISEGLDMYINRIQIKRYDCNISKLRYLVDDLGLSYRVLGERLGRTPGSIHHLIYGINKINKATQNQIDELLKFSLSVLESKIKNNIRISKEDYATISNTITAGRKLLNPGYKPGNNFYKPKDTSNTQINFLHRGG